jgi:glucose/arabinose dehydrogenase
MKTALRALLLASTLLSLPPLLADTVRVSLRPVAEGLVQPTAFAALPDGRALIADQVGLIHMMEREGGLAPGIVLSITNQLSRLNTGSFDERGLLCVTLHPGFTHNRRLFLAYTAPRRASAPADYDCALRVSEFQLPANEPLRIDPASEKVLLEIDHPYFNHNGGRLAFGPDGYLYISSGDGGGPKGCDIGNGHPPEGNGQNLRTLLAKILRVDVNGSDATRGTPYRIPSDNPFADGKAALPEIWAYGVRNPWSLTFDRGGDRALYVADIGQMRWEEVNIIHRGGNYGWPLREGFEGMNREHPERPSEVRAATGLLGEPLIDPIAVYKNPSGFKNDPEALGISTTGGYVYRGLALPALHGDYVFGDWSGTQGTPQGRLFVARRPADGGGVWRIDTLRVEGSGKLFGCVCAFGEGADGELYVLTNGSTSLRPGRGRVWRLEPHVGTPTEP